LRSFLPEGFDDPVEQRTAVASTLIAGLEMARGGRIELHQEAAFAPIMIRRRTEEGGSDGRTD
jgi:segregation and condensation protein A